MKYLCIKSSGEMALEAMSLIGASTKRGDSSKIGMFGSGLKYAVASILRQGLDFRVFSGTDEIKITTKQVNLRGKGFENILINGKETSLTTSMGTEDWYGAFPFVREIYSNALDEGEAKMSITDGKTDIASLAEEGKTMFFIEINKDVTTMLDNFDKYFSKPKNALWEDEISGNAIHRTRGATRIYRSNILVYKTSTEALFSYNINNIIINESRVAKYSWRVEEKIAALIEACTDKRIIRTIFSSLADSNTGFLEHRTILSAHEPRNVSGEYIECILEAKYYPIEMRDLLEEDDKMGRIGMSTKWLQRARAICPDVDVKMLSEAGNSSSAFVEKVPSTELFNKISDIISEIKDTPYGSRLVAKIVYGKFMSSTTYSDYDPTEDTIKLSVKLEFTEDKLSIIRHLIQNQEALHRGTDMFASTKAASHHFITLFYPLLTQLSKKEVEATNPN